MSVLALCKLLVTHLGPLWQTWSVTANRIGEDAINMTEYELQWTFCACWQRRLLFVERSLSMTLCESSFDLQFSLSDTPDDGALDSQVGIASSGRVPKGPGSILGGAEVLGLNEIFERIAAESSRLAHYNRRSTITSFGLVYCGSISQCAKTTQLKLSVRYVRQCVSCTLGLTFSFSVQQLFDSYSTEYWKPIFGTALISI